MKKIFLLMLLFLNFHNFHIYSLQKVDKPIIYIYADKLPKFNYDGGLHKYIYSNLKWPYQADVEGDVLVSFVIQKNGSVKNIKIEKGLVDIFDNEAIRVLENMPDWEPGEKDSEKVDIKMYLPIEFSLKKK